jgi:hypothetical protein
MHAEFRSTRRVMFATSAVWACLPRARSSFPLLQPSSQPQPAQSKNTATPHPRLALNITLHLRFGIACMPEFLGGHSRVWRADTTTNADERTHPT